LTVIPSPSYARAMITKISALIAVVGLAGICVSQAQSPTPAESPTKHRVAKKAHATPSPTEVAASVSPAVSPTASPKAKRVTKKEATAAAHVTPSPSPGKFNLGDLFKPKTSGAAASPAAAAPAPAKGTSAQAKAPAPGGGHGKVWVNTETHVYHKEGSRFYGTTKKGQYMTEAEAIKAGNKLGAERH
jgi:pyruvate/2-oxoglutarate dehydrogenase complex dihydrolipoamide acyltransferase (E2) component